MNKTFVGIFLAVCVLGMALAMFSERLRREPESSRTVQMAAADTQLPNLAESNTPASTPEVPIQEAPDVSAMPSVPDAMTFAVEKKEEKIASEALAPPLPSPVSPPETPTIAPSEKPVLQESAPADPPAPARKPAPRQETAEKVEAQPAPPAKPAPQTSTKLVPASQPKTAAAQGGVINNFVVFARDNGATVRIGGDRKIKYSSMTLENPHRVVVDLDGKWDFPAKLPIPKNEMVNSIRVGKNGDKTRVVIDLKAKPKSSRMVTGQNGNSVDVRVDK